MLDWPSDGTERSYLFIGAHSFSPNLESGILLNRAWSGGFAPILHNSLGATLIVDTMAAYEASIEWVFQSRGTVRVKTGE